jgi:ankyrin repeat protein
MKIVNVFDAITDGTYEDFIKYYDGNVNQVNPYTNLNLMLTAMVNDKNPDEKLAIIKHLISEGIDINFVDPISHRNALHTLFFNLLRGNSEYITVVVKMLVDFGVDINGKDKYDAVPLKYAITVMKNSTDDLKNIYVFLLGQGSEYMHKDMLGKSCVDYAKEYSWRNEFLNILKEYENEN